MSIKYSICEVRWKDAWVDFVDLTLEEAKELKAVERFTVGYLIDIKESEGLILCTDFYPEEEEYINTPIVIPWGMITNYRIIKDKEVNSFDKDD
jgi:hypothetical protein